MSGHQPFRDLVPVSPKQAALEKAHIDKIANLPKPHCKLGYTVPQVVEIMNSFPQEVKGDNIVAFNSWMSGQTGAICEGKSYDYVERKYVPNDCVVGNPNGHGMIVYQGDVRRFLLGLPIVD